MNSQRGRRPAWIRWFGTSAGCALAWCVVHGAPPLQGNAPTTASAGQTRTNSPFVVAKPVLPVVLHQAAQQPVIGIPADRHLDRTPPRLTTGLDLVKSGWSYNCMECHKLIPARWHYDRPMAEHENIKLEHGNNRFCLNCHHPVNRMAFVDYDGAEIAEKDVSLLCAKCHGTTYRDWSAGVHGRRNGYWNSSLGPQTRLRCIQCHDPHKPKYQPMKPLPPPHYPARAAHSAEATAMAVQAHH